MAHPSAKPETIRALGVSCPSCGMPAGMACTSGNRRASPHAARKQRSENRYRRPPPLPEAEHAMWVARAKRLLERALAEFDDHDPIPDMSAAETALRVAEGSVPAEDLAGYPFPGEVPEQTRDCTCPPEVLAKNDGSYRGGCPVHGF